MNASNRNKPCSCGSGKKEKRCCFDEVRLKQEAEVLAKERMAQRHAEWVANGSPFVSGTGIPDYGQPRRRVPLSVLPMLMVAAIGMNR